MVETKPCPIPGITKEQYTMFLKLFGKDHEEPVVANMAVRIMVDDNWVVDSGATEHITHQGHLLKNLSMNTLEKPVTILNGESIPGLKTGSLIRAVDCRGGLSWMGGIKEERQAMMVTIDSWHKPLGHPT
ncbi:hypothetical protein Tco_0931640 [Tanacetum coccineum]